MALASLTPEQVGSTLDHPIAWEHTRLPRGVAAVFAALQFSPGSPSTLRSLSDSDWRRALAFTDLAGLTLMLGGASRDGLPGWVEERLAQNLIGNGQRLDRLRALLAEISAAFDAASIDYLVLKGFSQQSDYVSDPRLRMAFDIDLFAPRHALQPALDAVLALGYEMLRGTEKLPTDHVPPLIRKTGWRWRGDFFDADIPGVVDLHFQFWDAATECFDAPGVDEFWNRRRRNADLPVLHPVDRLGYAAIHSLRHLLRGSVRPSQVYEIACFLQGQADHDSFWHSWLDLHPEPLRRLETVLFRLAARWFGCRLPPAVHDAIRSSASSVSLWFDRYAAAPVEAAFHPNKHELWLHFALLDGKSGRRRVFLRKMLPATLPAPTGDVFVPEAQRTLRMRARVKARHTAHLVRRALYHARVIPATLVHGAAWRWRASRQEAPFWRFLLIASLFGSGLGLFYLLYNLYLLDCAYREDVLGRISGAFTAGCLAGVLPAAALAHRLGLKRTLAVCFSGTAAVFLVRATVTGEPALVSSAFAGGIFFGIWATCVAPSVSALTTERNRPAAFSLIFGVGIAVGALAGFSGGYLPGWISHAGLAADALHAKRLALIAASALAALAMLPLVRLRIPSPRLRASRRYPSGPFIRRFIVAIALWNLATGLFNPLFNAYFARRFTMPAGRIGGVYSIAQLAQLGAMLLAPAVMRRLGLVRGVAAMQLATALTLAALAAGPTAAAAATFYAAYASLQYMSEPGIFSLLMNSVPPEQSSGASALNFLVLFSAQAAAAWLGGAVVAAFGYPSMLAAAAVMAGIAAVGFWLLLRNVCVLDR